MLEIWGSVIIFGTWSKLKEFPVSSELVKSVGHVV